MVKYIGLFKNLGTLFIFLPPVIYSLFVSLYVFKYDCALFKILRSSSGQ